MPAKMYNEIMLPQRLWDDESQREKAVGLAAEILITQSQDKEDVSRVLNDTLHQQFVFHKDFSICLENAPDNGPTTKHWHVISVVDVLKRERVDA